MCRNLTLLISVVLVLGLACSAPAATWTNDGNGNSWCERFNWDANIVPGPGDTAIIRQPQRGPVIDCDVDVAVIDGPSNGQVMDVISGTVNTTGNWDCRDGSATINITGNPVVNIGGSWRQDHGTVTLNISGNPTITVSGAMKLADEGGDWCTVNMSGGSLTVGARLGWEDHGGGVLNMSGGATIECGEFNYSGDGGDPWTLNLNGGTFTVLGRLRAPESSDGVVTINLDAGTLECGEFDHAGNYAMDINEGMFIIDGDERVAMNADVTAGYITAFSGAVGVIVTYDGDLEKTIVKADYVQVKASDPSPDNHAQNECPGVELSWQAGQYVDDHNVYFGTSLSDVNESADPCLEDYVGTQWTPSGLELGTTYYWRIDTVKDACDASPWVGDIWEFTTNDGNAFDPYPAHGQTAVPLNPTLHWTLGCLAASHDFYFGTDYDEVSAAEGGSEPNVYYEDLGDVNNYDACTPDYFTYYYWRIDEVDNGTTYKGKVWSFRSGSIIDDPNLILWYKFDESQGLIASDSSGYEHHGIGHEIGGQWEPNNGQIDGCLDFDASEHVAVPSDTLETINKEITVSVWVKGDDDHADEEGRVFDTGGGDYYMRARIPTDDGYLLWRAGNDTNDSLVWYQASPLVWAEEWHHFAFVKDENAGTMKIYFDGFEVESKTGTIISLTNVKDRAFRIGADNDQTSDYTGKLDDFRVYNCALSDSEIAGLFRCGDVALAWAPSPYNGQVDAAYDVLLSWLPGDYAASHDVYVGTSWDDINDVNSSNYLSYPDVDYNNVQDTNYSPGLLELGQMYYWRVDEVNDPCLWKGNLWRFTVAEYITIDDFEKYDVGYADDQDGSWEITPDTGSTIEFGDSGWGPVRGGEMSMIYWYDNTWDWGPGYYSEASTEDLNPTDWNDFDMKVLTLWFYGDPLNDAGDTEQMYVGVEDSAGLYAELRYGDNEGEDMNDIKIEAWQRWDIPLTYFSDSNFAAVPNDVNLADVEKLIIGFGIRGGDEEGGEGTVYFDDIRLCPAFCDPVKRPLEGDLNGDCAVDFGDVEIMAREWLDSDCNCIEEYGSMPPPPVTAPNMVAWYKFNDGAGGTANEEINNYDGTISVIDVNVSWVTGHEDDALKFTGGWVTVPNEVTPELNLTDAVTMCVWINLAEITSEFVQIVCKGRDDYETFSLEINEDGGLTFFVRDVNDRGDAKKLDSERTLPTDTWIHVAGTYDGNCLTSYVNGKVHMQDPNVQVKLYTDANDGLVIGGRWGDGGNFKGKIDDVRIYDYGLSGGEICYIASDGDGAAEMVNIANVFTNESEGTKQAVNLKDFAKLANNWRLKEIYWPE